MIYDINYFEMVFRGLGAGCGWRTSSYCNCRKSVEKKRNFEEMKKKTVPPTVWCAFHKIFYAKWQQIIYFVQTEWAVFVRTNNDFLDDETLLWHKFCPYLQLICVIFSTLTDLKEKKKWTNPSSDALLHDMSIFKLTDTVFLCSLSRTFLVY